MIVTDGTSNSIIIAEDAGRIRVYELGREVSGQTYQGGAWYDYYTWFMVGGSTTLNGGANGCTVNCSNKGEIYSFHTGGAMVAMADGSVHFLRQSVRPLVLAGLISRAGGEVVSISDQ